MNRKKIAAFLGLIMCLGCGSPHERLMKEQVKCLEDAIQILNSICDTDTAQAARLKLGQILDRLQRQNEQSRALPTLSPEELHAIESKAAPVLGRLNEAGRAAADRPGGEVAREFLISLRKLP